MTHQKFDYFMIVAAMRTGSNMLERSLDRFEELSCFGELYNPAFIGFPIRENELDISIKDRAKDPIALLDMIKSSSAPKIPGFRIFPDHDAQILTHGLQDPNCAKIILTRNPLDSFVSLEIARETDQWRMGDINLKQEAMPAFDQDAFEIYLDDLRNFHRDVESVLQRSGQTAFRIQYDDLSDLDAVNGLAAFIGATQKLKNFKFRGSKQNPGRFADKISNFDAVMENLHPIKMLQNEDFEFKEPTTRQASSDIFIASNLDIAYFPTRGQSNDPIPEWIMGIDPKQDAPRNEFNKSALKKWMDTTDIKITFADLEHPVERAYRCFSDLFLFPMDGRYFGIRTLLMDKYGLELLPNNFKGQHNLSSLTDAGYDEEKHRNNFKKFLRFLKATLQDQAMYQPKPEYCSQTERLLSYSDITLPQFVALPHTRHLVLPTIAKFFGADESALPKSTEPNPFFNLIDIFDYKIEELARAAYARDYKNFGFTDFTLAPN